MTNVHICMSFLLPLGYKSKWKAQPLHPRTPSCCFPWCLFFCSEGLQFPLGFHCLRLRHGPSDRIGLSSHRLKHALGCVRSVRCPSCEVPFATRSVIICNNRVDDGILSNAFASSWTILSILVSNRIICTCAFRRESCNAFPSAAMRFYWKRRILPFWSFASDGVTLGISGVQALSKLHELCPQDHATRLPCRPQRPSPGSWKPDETYSN